MQRYTTIFLAFSLFTTVFTCQILQSTDIAPHHDLANQRSANAQGCCNLCRKVPDCVAFTWNSYNGGTCYFKGATAPLVKQSGVTAGVVHSGTGYSCSGPISGRDIKDNNLKQVPNTPPSGCCRACAQTQGCRAWAWNDSQGGSCWLKSKDGPLVPKQGVVASVFYGSGPTPAGKWRILKSFHLGSRESIKSEWDVQVWPPRRVNNELEAYIDSDSTLFNRDGALVIRAFKQGNQFVSARIQSKMRFNAGNVPSKKIRYEFTGTVPTAKGAWPAYWVLGDSNKYGGWPTEGEIDVMEWVYQLHGSVKSSLHWRGSNDWGTGFSIPASELTREYYTYGAEVSAVPGDEYVQFYVRQPDGKTRYGKIARSGTWTGSFPTCPKFVPGAKKCSPLAPFDNDMYLIINLAVGGDWGGCCGVDGDYSAFNGGGVEMKIKAVTVYEAT